MLHRVPLAAAVLLVLVLHAPPVRSEPAREIRGIWVTRWDFRTRDDVQRAVEGCAALGFNRIYFQVRGRADAFYRSALEPWGEELGGRDPGFDPLEVAIAASRARGVELHAWINVLPGWKGKRPPRSPRHVYHRHPDWFLLDRYGKRQLLDSHYTILNPCLAEVRRHIVSVVTDIARRYPVDGVHLDYIRFVAEGAKARQAVPYDRPTLAVFRRLTGGFPTRYPVQWNNFRRQAIDSLVAEISRSVRAVRPGTRLSAAVLRDLDRARERYFQDAPAWRTHRWVDELVIMNYERHHRPFARYARTALARGARPLVCGIGVYLLESPEALRTQVELARRLGTRGYSVFAYSSFFSTPSPAARHGPAARRLQANLRREVQRLNSNAAAGDSPVSFRFSKS